MQSIYSAEYKNPSAGFSDKKGALADASAILSEESFRYALSPT
jgi:hypothetical protein